MLMESYRQCINQEWYSDSTSARAALERALRNARKWDASHLDVCLFNGRAACFCTRCSTYITCGLSNLAKAPGPRWHECGDAEEPPQQLLGQQHHQHQQQQQQQQSVQEQQLLLEVMLQQVIQHQQQVMHQQQLQQQQQQQQGRQPQLQALPSPLDGPFMHAGGFGMGDVPMLPAEEGSLVDDGYQEDAAPVAAEPFRQCINGVWYEDPNAACDALNTYLRRAKKWDAGHLEARIRVDRAACYCRMCRTYITQGLGNLARPPGPRWHSCRDHLRNKPPATAKQQHHHQQELQQQQEAALRRQHQEAMLVMAGLQQQQQHHHQHLHHHQQQRMSLPGLPLVQRMQIKPEPLAAPAMPVPPRYTAKASLRVTVPKPSGSNRDESQSAVMPPAQLQVGSASTTPAQPGEQLLPNEELMYGQEEEGGAGEEGQEGAEDGRMEQRRDERDDDEEEQQEEEAGQAQMLAYYGQQQQLGRPGQQQQGAGYRYSQQYQQQQQPRGYYQARSSGTGEGGLGGGGGGGSWSDPLDLLAQVAEQQQLLQATLAKHATPVQQQQQRR